MTHTQVRALRIASAVLAAVAVWYLITALTGSDDGGTATPMGDVFVSLENAPANRAGFDFSYLGVLLATAAFIGVGNKVNNPDKEPSRALIALAAVLLITALTFIAIFFTRTFPKVTAGLTETSFPTTTVPREALADIHGLAAHTLPETLQDNSAPLTQDTTLVKTPGTFRGEEGIFWSVTTTGTDPIKQASNDVTVIDYQTLVAAQ